jgi:bifunctional DNA-binding transcriptional regulator/antitoxin component of YhaV-PrlF toxin-antitoxin module
VEIRRRCNGKEGDRVEFIDGSDRVTIEPVGDVVERTTGAFAKYRREPAPTIEELKEAIAGAWAVEAMRGTER